VADPESVKPGGSNLQCREPGDPDGHLVQSGTRLVESLATIAAVSVQPKIKPDRDSGKNTLSPVSHSTTASVR
jgi:hypothetical protein